jgi:hypothetical protein
LNKPISKLYCLPCNFSKIDIFKQNKTLKSLTIVRKNGFYYPATDGIKKPYIKLDGYCQLCPNDEKCYYYFTIQHRPLEHDEFVVVSYSKRGEHKHENQLKPDKRMKLEENFEFETNYDAGYDDDVNI